MFHHHLPNERIPFILKYSNFLNSAKWRKRFLQYLFSQATGKRTTHTATIHGAVSRAALIVHLIECQRFGVGCDTE